ncbi:MAG: BON domain-containing protein [Gammaproteobacteria bacterium]
MNMKLNASCLHQSMSLYRSVFLLSVVLLMTACATAVVVEQTEVRENDDRTELQRQLDSDISKNIKKRFGHSSVVKSTNLHVSTYKHVVTVNGFVENKNQKMTALRLALSVSGVKSVVSDIGIRKKE